MSELSPYKQIIPATDWYFRHDNVPGEHGESTVYQLAAWALKENGDIVGLVTVRDIDTGHPKLVTPPPVPGDYLHKEQLTDDEKRGRKSGDGLFIPTSPRRFSLKIGIISLHLYSDFT